MAIILPYAFNEQTWRLISPDEFNTRYPMTWAYLAANRATLEGRERGKMRNERWYGYVYPKNLKQMQSPKILTPSIAARASFSLDSLGGLAFMGSGGGGGGGYGITASAEAMKLEYLLGLLNSTLLAGC